MASFDNVVDCMTNLQQANLSYPPGDIVSTAKIWTRLLQDVPDDALTQATDDLILTSKEFPKLSELREAAKQVGVHNGQSAAANPFRDDSAPRRVAMVRFSPQAESLIVALETKYYDDGLPTDAELTEVDRLTGGVL
jgi:hypothetical protein